VSGDDDDKTRLERLLEAGVYAPVGFLVTRSKTVPDLAKAGRKQIAFAQSLGRAALRTLARGARRDPGAAPGGPSERAPVPSSAAAASPRSAVDEDDVVEKSGAGTSEGSEHAESVARAEPPAPAGEPVEPKASVGTEESPDQVEAAAIEGYDDLTAREIIELIKTGDAARSQWVHDRETAGKGRVTVLRAASRELD